MAEKLSSIAQLLALKPKRVEFTIPCSQDSPWANIYLHDGTMKHMDVDENGPKIGDYSDALENNFIEVSAGILEGIWE